MSHPKPQILHCAPGDLNAPIGQLQWFRDEVQTYDRQLKSYLRAAFPAVRDVDDVVQESYLRIWKRQTARPIASAKAFLFTIARRLALDLLRHRRRSPIDEVTDISSLGVIAQGPGVSEVACTREEVEFLYAAIARLPARTREVYLLRKFEGLSQREIAAKLGVSVNTVEVHIGRANRRCEEFLRQLGVIPQIGA